MFLLEAKNKGGQAATIIFMNLKYTSHNTLKNKPIKTFFQNSLLKLYFA